MPTLIRSRQVANDNWRQLELAPDHRMPAIAADGDLIVPLAQWQDLREQLLARPGRCGVSLDAGDEVESLVAHLDRLSLVAVAFPRFGDGRGYSTGRLLRERYAFAGELRATGEILPDQLPLLERCGFDAFVLRDGWDAQDALRAFHDFSEAYQASVLQPLPLFRRRGLLP